MYRKMLGEVIEAIENHFCDDKLSIMNEIKNTKQNKTLQKYQQR